MEEIYGLSVCCDDILLNRCLLIKKSPREQIMFLKSWSPLRREGKIFVLPLLKIYPFVRAMVRKVPSD